MPKMLLFIVGLCFAVFCNVADGATKPVIEIKAESKLTLGVKEDFRFICTAVSKNYTISLLVDGELNSPKLKRITNTTESKETNAIRFVFSDTTVKDNGTTFMCGATNTSVKNPPTNFSDVLTLQVEDNTKPVIEIEAESELTLGVEDEFRFNCTAVSKNYTISLLVDGELNSPKLNKITNTTESKETNAIKFVFSNTTAYDNGTTFMCGATDTSGVNATTNFSDVLTLQVEYAPYFEDGNNETLLAELAVGKTDMLSCNISMSNPPVKKIIFTNTSTHFTNVNSKVSDKMASIIFTKAEVTNKGTYTCTAVNALGNTTLSYRTYVGGPPDGLKVDPTFTVANETLLIAFGLDDSSDAPALAMSYSVPGLIESKIVNFGDKNISIPVKKGYYQEVDESIDFIEAGNYTLLVTAYNFIGNVTVLNESRFIPGLSANVKIKTPVNVTEGKNFTFTCEAAKPANFTVFVVSAADKTGTLERLMTGKKISNKSQDFVLRRTTYRDNGTVLQCVADEKFRSNTSDVVVLFHPRYSENITELTGLNGTMNTTVNIPTFASNPEPTKFTWMKNGKELKSGNRLTIINATALMFNPLLQEDMGNYTVVAENKIGKGNGTATIDVQWPPYSLGPVVIPTLKAGNTTYDVFLNISANPDITYTEWKRHGKDITNDTNISPGLSIMSFLSLLPADNGSYSAIVYNDVGNVTILFDMMVLYPPIIKMTGNKIGAFLMSHKNITISVDANPTNYTFKWMKDGKELKKTDELEFGPDYLVFKNISNEDIGNYSIEVTNDEGSAVGSFELSTYDGPYFEEGKSNSSVLSEIKTGSNTTITCTVKESNPKVTDLRIEPAAGTNWKTKKENDSITLTIDKASAGDNRRNFTCYAVNNVTTATLTFTNFVGGAPDKVVVDVKKVVTDDNEVQLTLNVTDSSDAPATEILVYLKEVMKANKTLKLPTPSLNKKVVSFEFKNAIVEKFEALGAGTHNVTMYARNLIGDVRLKDYSFTTPSKPKPTPKSNKKSSTIKIAVGVSVPVAVIIMIAVVVGGYFFYRKRKNGEYSPLSIQADGTEDSSNYGGTD